MKILKAATLLLMLTVAARATPITTDEMLAQDPKPTGTVTIVETQECCEDHKAGVPWWPFLFAGAIPLAFIDWSHEQPPEILQPPSTTTPTPGPTPEAVPEPPTLSLGLLAVAGLFVWRKRR